MSLYSGIPYTPKKRLPVEIGCLFISARSDLGLSIEQLAQRAGVGPLDVRLWETAPPGIGSLRRILRVLRRDLIITEGGVSLKYLDSKLPPADHPVMNKPSSEPPGLGNWP